MASEEDLKALKASRGYTKTGIKRLQNFLSNENEVAITPVFNLLARKAKLEATFLEYERYNKQIFCLDPSDQENVEEIENRYFHLITLINEEVKKRESKSDSVPSQSTTRTNLPTINISTFTGKYADYVNFINLFKSLIHSDRSLDKIQKLHYLRSFVKDEPYELIKNLPLECDSYDEALRLLEDRYFNKFRIITEHVNELLDLGAMAKSTSCSIREFVSKVKQSLSSLKNLGVSIEGWDPILVCLLTRKLDAYTRRTYQLERDHRKEPGIVELMEFLESRALALENSQPQPFKESKPSWKAAMHLATSKSETSCLYCKLKDHKIFMCQRFKLLPVMDRISFVKENNLCKVCLNSHKNKCKYFFKCGDCKQRHNTLLHTNSQTEKGGPVTLLSGNNTNNVLLPTAKVKLLGKNGKEVHCRAILDSGSQISLVTSKVVDVLGLTPIQTNTHIVGIANMKNHAKYSIPLEVHSLNSPFSTSINFHVVDKITCNLPQAKLDLTSFKIPPNVELADNDFYMPGAINMLIGADKFFQLLLPADAQPQTGQTVQANQEHVANQATSPIFINTLFGTVVAGTLLQNVSEVVTLFCTKCESDISQSLSSFLDIEKVPQYLSEKSSEFDIAESIFQSTVKLENNKFTVDLPLKLPPTEINENLGDSFDLAFYRFLNLEKRLHKNINLLTEYQNFIDEYVEMGHGHYVDISSYSKNEPPYYMPHHAVVNENSTTTRTRVVFDGSMKTKKGISLNDIIMNGPVVQRDLFDIILLYRFGEYAFTTDIKRMFRNILLNPEHTSLQNILWRNSPDKPIECIRLDTVTYGLKSSSYLATRCLYELANRYEGQWPLASFILKNCTYVDDVCYADANLNILLEARDQLGELLRVASLETHKWSSNSSDVLKAIPSSKQLLGNLDLQKDYSVKTLGLTIDAKQDRFTLQCLKPCHDKPITKREILSYISKIYDPLGFVSPIVVKAKEFMKRVWCQKLNWNDTPSERLTSEWSQFTNSLAAMQPIHINRNIPIPYSATVQLIGFADASSTTAYGCCVYLRVVQPTGEAILYLLCSKSRINPSAKPLTIPRLELNACLLLSNLIAKVYETLSIKVKINSTYLFSDSKIALAWINTEPTRLQAYVANRVKVVQQLTTRCWLYVQTNNNPADLVSTAHHS
ncbi:unnamed protein product [Euphydryas editha]|uniref:Peptidase aspartic putative domain-containing protein n=1 Tax=Euphydryas editha TaxID=104508 RepID=A0AAU9UJ23_EUPED|nr:unnamed protein product [Euphydryas editha]